MGFRDDLKAMLTEESSDRGDDSDSKNNDQTRLQRDLFVGGEIKREVYFLSSSLEQQRGFHLLKSELKKSSEPIEQPLYLDLEFEHKKGVKGAVPALLQLSVGQSIFVIDLLETELSLEWRELLSDQRLIWVLHDARQDIKLLVSRLLIKPPLRLFDTQVAWGLVSIVPEISLSALMYERYGQIPDKSLQAGRFLTRPLPQDMLRYSAEDIPPLIELYEDLKTHLGDRVDAVFEASRERVAFADTMYEQLMLGDEERSRERKVRSSDQLARFSSKLWTLSPQQVLSLRRLLSLSESLREGRLSLSLHPKVCLHIAQLSPRTKSELLKMQGVDYTFIQSTYGDEVIDIIESSIKDAPREWSDQNESPWRIIDRPLPQMVSSARSQSAQVIYLCYAKYICAELSARAQMARVYLLDEKTLKRSLEDVQDRSKAQEVIKTHFLRGWRSVLRDQVMALVELYPLVRS